MAYRATKTEPQVAVGEWTKDLAKGQVFATADVPDYVADHLLSHGLLVECPDDAEDNPWFDSEDPSLNSVGAGSIKKPVEDKAATGDKVAAEKAATEKASDKK